MFWHQKAVSGIKLLLLKLTVYLKELILSKMDIIQSAIRADVLASESSVWDQSSALKTKCILRTGHPEYNGILYSQ